MDYRSASLLILALISANAHAVAPVAFDDDFAAGATTNMQAKQILFQFGSTAGRCCAIDFPCANLDAAPAFDSSGELVGVRVTGHGETTVHSGASDASIANSAMRIHYF